MRATAEKLAGTDFDDMEKTWEESRRRIEEFQMRTHGRLITDEELDTILREHREEQNRLCREMGEEAYWDYVLAQDEDDDWPNA